MAACHSLSNSRILDRELFWHIADLAVACPPTQYISTYNNVCNLYSYFADHYYLILTKPKEGEVLLDWLKKNLSKTID